MDAVRLLDLGCVPYRRSQAVYHAVAEAMTARAPDTVILLWPDRPYFCVGFHQDPRRELDLDFCRRRGLPVLRRQVGGGTTYLDSLQLFYQVVLHHQRAPQRVDALYAHCLTPPLEALRALGLGAALRGVNELTVRGRRIGGTGAARLGEASVVVGNFLFDFDYATMARAWRVPSETFRRLAYLGLERHLTTLRREMATPPSLAAARALLVEQFERAWGRPLAPGTLTAREEALAAEVACRLEAPEWLFEVSGGAHRRVSLKIADGVFVRETTCQPVGGRDRLDVIALVRGDVLEALVLDAAARGAEEPWGRVAEAFAGCLLSHAALHARAACIQQAGLLPPGVDVRPLVDALTGLVRPVTVAGERSREHPSGGSFVHQAIT